MAKLEMGFKTQLVNKYRPHFDAYSQFALADLHLPYKVKLTFDQTPHTYTNKNLINIGLENVDVSSEEEFLIMVDYLIGHEVQHIRSTPDKIWIWAQKRGIEVILEAASAKLEKKRRLFRKDNDYDLFLRWLSENGYSVSVDELKSIVHFIKNSLEDGRIERIRSIKRKGFKEKMTVIRGRIWEENPCEEGDVSKMPAYEKLSIVLNQILCLSTTSLYQKDFKKYYGGTELEKWCEDIMPYIAKGVTGYSCKDCMDASIQIMEYLALPIIEACRTSSIEDIIRHLIKMLIDDESVFGDNDEESTSKTGSSPFGVSDIILELTQEEYDKLKEKSNDEEYGDGLRINIIIKEKKENDEAKNNTGNSQPHNSGAVSEVSESEGNAAQEAVKEAMKKASLAENTTAEAIKRSANPPQKASRPLTNVPESKGITENVAGNPQAANVKNLYGERIGFKEFTREYPLDLPLPYWLKGKSDVFSKKIDEVLKNQYKPAIRCRKTGKVDGMMIHKLAMNQTDIFVKPARTDKFSDCCYMLVDNSGSMGYGENSKREYAWNAIAEIEAGYSKLMPLKIVAFDTQGIVCHEIVKDWNEVLPKSGAYNYMIHGRDGGGNMDGYSISIATDEILRQSGNKKLLIVLSDGAPDSYERTKQAILYARKNGIILVGIYFSDVGNEPSPSEIQRFESMYGTDGYAICTAPENISSELYKVMKREFLS